MIRTEMIASIPELMHRHAGARGDKLAFADVHSAVTYGDLMRTTGNLAGSLSGASVSPGHAVAILLPNSVEWVQSCLAINRAGALAVPISYDSSLPEIVYRMVDSGSSALITTAEMMDIVVRIRSQAPGLTTVICVGAGSTPSTAVSTLWCAAIRPYPGSGIVAGSTCGCPKKIAQIAVLICQSSC